MVGAGSSYAVDATGGSANAIVVTHTHTATSAVTDPGHFHSVESRDSGGSSDYLGQTNNTGTVFTYDTSTKTTGITVATTVASAGTSGTNANLPPYYALCYIMKT